MSTLLNSSIGLAMNATRYLQPDGTYQSYLDIKIGDIRQTNAGDRYEITEHVGGINYKIKFIDDNGYTRTVTHQSILQGSIRNPMRYELKDGKLLTSKDITVGGIYQGSQGAEFTVISKSDKTAHWIVKFNDDYEHQMTVSTQAILKGSPKNPYRPSVFGVGFVGVGKYTPTVIGASGKGRITPEYRAWGHMLERSYYPQYHERFPTYRGCEVCKEWHNFQVFAEWYTAQKGYELGWSLDKDLLGDGSGIYGPSTCILIPIEINGMLNAGGILNSESTLPSGIAINKQGRYQVAIRFTDTPRHTKSFDTLREAIHYRNQQVQSYINRVIQRYITDLSAVVLKALKRRLREIYLINPDEY